MKPFLIWAGGKRWLVANYAGLLAVPNQRLLEPFLGSGAVFFHLQPSSALLADSNEQLIEAYEAVRDGPEEVLGALKDHQRRHSKAHYYTVRMSAPRTGPERAAKFIYLNRTCFNGLYRVNLQGEFNVPKGTKQTVLFPDDDFHAWATMLAGATLVAQDFEKTVDSAGPGDLIYADPPYTVNHNVNNFVKYNERIFSWADQIRLAESLTEATRRGARVVVSNADHISVRELYSTAGWICLTVHRHSRLAASSTHRKATTEILLANCLSTDGEQTDPRPCGSLSLDSRLGVRACISR